MCKAPLAAAAAPAGPSPAKPAPPPASARSEQQPAPGAVRVVKRMVGPARPPTGRPTGSKPAEPAPPPAPEPVRGGLDASKIVAWLCCDPLPPLPLGAQPRLTIGRTPPAELVLPHKEVSRRHATLKAHGKSILLEDEGSSNGVFLNGHRVSSAALKVGDKLTIGPYELEVRSNEDMARPGVQDGSTPTNPAFTSLQRVQPGAAMTGRLDEVPAGELLQQLEFNKKTGTLTIHVPGGEGELVVEGGRPVRARFRQETDDAAVIRLALLTSGRFTFTARVQPGERRMQGTLTALLFEASRQADELARVAAEPAAPAADDESDEEPTTLFQPDPEQPGPDDAEPDGGATQPVRREAVIGGEPDPPADEPTGADPGAQPGEGLDSRGWQEFWER